MKITVEINGKPVEIELTKDQVAKVKKQTEKIIDRVKSYEDACEVLGIKPITSAHCVDKLKTICTALNEGWTPDWKNSNQAKYVPYFTHNGTEFVCDDDINWRSRTDVGSRLCFGTSELAIYAAKQFSDLYNEFLN